MSELRKRALAAYAEYYQTQNTQDLNPTLARPSSHCNYDLNFGRFVRSVSGGGRMLDVGCGTGFLVYWLSRQPGITAVGVDGSQSQVALANRFMPGVEVVCDDALHYLKAHPDEFSGIFCMDVLQLFADEDFLFDWVLATYNALKPGGFFCAQLVNCASLIGPYNIYMDILGARGFTSGSARQLFSLAGFRDIEVCNQRTAGFSGWARFQIEQWLHRAVFLISGNGAERVFSRSLTVVGYRR